MRQDNHRTATALRQLNRRNTAISTQKTTHNTPKTKAACTLTADENGKWMKPPTLTAFIKKFPTQDDQDEAQAWLDAAIVNNYLAVPTGYHAKAVWRRAWSKFGVVAEQDGAEWVGKKAIPELPDFD